MKRRQRTPATCASLLVLLCLAVWGQQLPAWADNGPPPSQFATGSVAPPASHDPLYGGAAGSGLELHRLPATGHDVAPLRVAKANPGWPRTSLVGAFSDHAPAVDCCGSCQKVQCECGPRWMASADLLWMSRSRVSPQTMIESPLGGLVISESFNARELVFDARAGYRASWGYDLLDGRAVELTTFSVFDQPARADVSDTDMFFTFHQLPAAVATDAYTINYVSNLHNGELNWWFGEAWGIRPMIGARWIRVREEFSIVDPTDTSWDAFSDMQNDLIGAQIGFKTCLWSGADWIRVEAAVKSGVYHNDVDYQARVVDAVGAAQGSIRRDPSATSFAGEITVSAVLQCSSHLALRCGYQGLWMSEIGLAPNQANQSDIATGIGTDYLGALNYQGGFLGLEANW